MTMFSATFADVAVSAAQDLFEITAPADSRVLIHEIDIGQYSDAGDAAAEILGLQIIRGYTVSGSGGSSVTPGNLNSYGRAAGAVVEANNTTVANTGTVETLLATVWHLQAGFIWRPDRPSLRDQMNAKLIQLAPSERLVVRITAPADAITTNGTIVFEEIGKLPNS